MAVGIGASSVMGIAFEQLPPPTQSALATASSGGTITAGTYKYIVTAINALGETTGSNEQTIVTTGATSTVTVTWVAVTGATGYKLYKTASGGATQTELNYKTVGAVTTDIDTAPGAPAGALPLVNTANTPNVYAPPVKFVPYLSEGLSYSQATTWRRPIRNTPGLVGAVAGDSQAGGDIVIEAISDVVPYFLYASRATVVKTGSAPYTYTSTPSPVAIPQRTMSITILRNNATFGYTGCTVGGFKFAINRGQLEFTATILARDEATQTAMGGITWPTTLPFGAGTYNIQIPTAAQVFDTDNFEFTSDDNPTAQFRLKNTGRGAQFVSFGESAATMKVDRDFDGRADYDAYKALTAQSITLIATQSASDSITLLMPASIKDSYAVNIGGQGDLVRASVTYQAAVGAGGNHYLVTVVTPTENIL